MNRVIAGNLDLLAASTLKGLLQGAIMAAKPQVDRRAKGRFPSRTKLFQAYVKFALRHPEHFPNGPQRALNGVFTVFEAIQSASAEGDADAYSFLLQGCLQFLGAPPPKNVFTTPIDAGGRGRPAKGSLRYAALAAKLLGGKPVKIAEMLFPDATADEGRPRVESLVKSAERDLERRIGPRRNELTAEEIADAKTAILREELRGWRGPSITKLAE